MKLRRKGVMRKSLREGRWCSINRGNTFSNIVDHFISYKIIFLLFFQETGKTLCCRASGKDNMSVFFFKSHTSLSGKFDTNPAGKSYLHLCNGNCV